MPADRIEFTVAGAPRNKKNSRRYLRLGKFTKSVPSEAYCRWQDEAVPAIERLFAGTPAIDRPVNVRALFYVEADRRVDASGLYDGIADILVRAGVLADDNRRILVSWDGSRVFVDRKRPRVELLITEAT